MRLAGLKLLGIFLSLPPMSPWDHLETVYCVWLYVGSGDLNSVLTFAWRVLYPLAHLRSLGFCSFVALLPGV